MCDRYLKRFFPTLLLLLFSGFCVQAQVIRADVSIDRSQINTTSLNYLDDFAQQIETYLNDNTWTNDNFQPPEAIEVSIQINLFSVTDDFRFDADIIIQSRRPIYNSNRQTTVFLYNDENWTFQYSPNRGLVHDELQFDELTTLLDFYAYIITGYDYDTFSELGGTPLFIEAQNMVAVAQSSPSTGWRRSSTVPRNRAQLVADLLNPAYEPLRRAYYVYHRRGLDLFLEDPENARNNIIEALKMIQKSKRQTTNNLLFDTFFNAKYRELVALFQDAATHQRLQVYNILSEIDPGHLTAYRQLQ